MAAPRKHVMFVSFPNVSHITCLLHLARRVANYHDVTFIASAFRVLHLRQKGIFSEEDEKSMYLVGLKDGITLEEGNDSSYSGMNTMLDKYQETLIRLMQTFPVTGEAQVGNQIQPVDREIVRPVDVYLTDLVASFYAQPVLDRGVPVIVFLASAGFVFSNKLNIDENTPVLPDDAYFSDWEAHDDISRTGAPGDFKKIMLEFYSPTGVGRRTHAVVLNSIVELEPVCIKTFRANPNYTSRLLRFVAPLFDTRASGIDDRSSPILAWLDKQQQRSVCYASFGTMAVSKKDQTEEIAKALLAIKKPFIWGLREEEHGFLPEKMQISIKEQFKNTDSQFLVVPWAPQRQILNHKATGVFLSHAGWNSYLESMDSGVPMVAWPLFGDHFGIAKMLGESGAGVVIPGTSMLFQNLIPADRISEAILSVGQWKDSSDTSNQYAKNAQAVGKIIKDATLPGGSSHKAFMDLVNIDIGGSEVCKKKD